MLWVIPAHSAGPAVSATSIQREIKSNGAASVVRRLTSGKGEQWQAVLRNIETGNKVWLKIAMGLLGGTDAGNTESLYYALSIALTRNAEGVLRLLGPTAPIQKICTVPYIEPSPKAVREYRIRAQAALAKVTDPTLAKSKRECLDGVEAGGK